jgi:VWFA-related protein
MRDWKVGVCVAALLVTPVMGTPQQPTLRIGVTAVEIDAVVVDGKGRHLPDLQASDFELLQDGKPQPITSFRYVPVRERATVTTQTPAPADSPVPLTSSAQLRRGHVGRVMAVIIDDVSVSFSEMGRLRSALSTFIDQDMRPDDAVAIITTSNGVGQLQQFTNDKAVLQEQVARLRISLMGRLGEGDEPTDQRGGADEFEDANQEQMQTGSLAAVQNVIRGMRELPGRKSVVYVSSGFALVKKDRRNDTNLNQLRDRLLEAFRRLVDESNRSFVVIHTIDSRGLANPAGGAFLAERQGPAPTPASLSVMVEDYRATEAGPALLAEQAGGLSFAMNDFVAALDKTMSDQEGYYVLGYQPESSTFQKREKKAEFHQIKVRVKRSGARVRTRSGFFGVTDEELHPAPKTAEEQLWTLAASPFVANDIGVRVTPLFKRAENGSGGVFKILLHLDGQDLTFAKSDDGNWRAPVEVFAGLIDGRGAAVTSKIFHFSVRAAEEPNAARRAAGFRAEVELPAAEPGAYQLRVVARDVGSMRSGTGYRFVQVPNLSKSRLALSGVTLQSHEPDLFGSPAFRRFPASGTVRYAFDAYNAEADPASHHPALNVRFRIYRDGSLLVDGKPLPFDTANVSGDFQLPATLTPAEYLLQVEVTDTKARNTKTNRARQWIDFTIASTQ